MDFLGLNIDETLKKLNTSIKGLNNEEVLKRRKKYGLNTFYLTNEFLKTFLIQLINPIILILVLTLIATLINKNYSDAVSISLIILVTIIFNIILDYKHEYPIYFEKLNSKKVLVIRNGKKVKINSKNITIGDIVVIEKNTFIKADMKVIVENNIKIKSPLNNAYTEENNILFAGDYVIEGSGMGVVFEIGKNTEIYKLAKITSQKRKQKSPFQTKFDKINRQICLFTFITTLLLWLILFINKTAYNLMIKDLTSLIIASIPIFYIIILVFILYYFEKKNKKTITINNLYSLNSIGNTTTIICKKDTLTINEITAQIIELEDGSLYEISGIGYNDVGEVIPTNPSAKYKDSLYNLNLLGKLVFLNNKAKLNYENDEWVTSGNKYGIALLALNQKINHCIFEETIIQEIKNEKYTITFYKEDDITKISIRGNVEDIIQFCNNNEDDILQRYNHLKSLGYIVIGVGEGKIKNKKKYTEKDIKNLNFIGLIGLINPLKEESKKAIEMCQKESLKVIITTNEDENNTEIFGKTLNIINKRNEIATIEDINHNFSLGERIFDDFIKEIKLLSNVSNEDLIKVIDSLKRQGEIISTIGNESEDINILKHSHISITNDTSLIKNASDLVIKNNNFETIINLVKNSQNIYNNILNIMKYLFSCKLMEVLIIFLSIIFETTTLSINQIIWIDLTSTILSLGLLSEKNYFNNNASKKDNFKLIITSICSGILTFMFILLLNKMELEKNHINSSTILLITYLQSILLFYFQNKNNSIFNLSFKENWKMYLLIILCLLIQLGIFIFSTSMSEVTGIAILITIGFSLIPIAIIEFIKKLKEI